MRARSLAIGTTVLARDCAGEWLTAKVIAHEGEGDPLPVRVHFYNYADRFDELIEDHERLAPLGTDPAKLPAAK